MINDDKQRIIGSLIYIAADKFTIELKNSLDNFNIVGFDDVHYIARLGSYLVIPTQNDYVIVEVIGIREKDVGNYRNFGEEEALNKPTSIKYLDVTPLGMLPLDSKEGFKFGISQYPSLYSNALYAKDSELDRIFQVTNCEQEFGDISILNAIAIGKSSVFENYDVKIDINKFFGGHVAILGNTGSGKSCTITSIMQELFRKNNLYYASGATFIIFDVNGEYHTGLDKLKNIFVKSVKIDGSSSNFHLPHWFLTLDEWELLLRASEKAQLPVLRSALGLASILNKEGHKKLRHHIIAKAMLEILLNNPSPINRAQRFKGLNEKYKILIETINYDKFGTIASEERLKSLLQEISNDLVEIKWPNYDGSCFDFSDLEDCIDIAILYEESHGNHQIRDYCASLLTRLQQLKNRDVYQFMVNADKNSTEKEFTKNILGLSETEVGLIKEYQVIIFDLSTLDDEIIDLVSAVISRLVFEFLKKQPLRNHFPVNLVLEEAHRYISQKPSKYAIEANYVFERIAKEGRKYGLFILLSSQRPSEISKTVLSQCSNYVVHRIQNPDDLQQIRQMTPFISDNLLKKLPSLPKQYALVFGNSVNIPTTVKINDANPRPRSDDAKISDLWYVSSDKKYSDLDV